MGSRRVPGKKYSLYGALKLLEWILGKLCDGFEYLNNRLPVFGTEIHIQLKVVRFLVVTYGVFKFLAINAEHNTGEHLDETPIRVVGKPRVIGFFGEPFCNLVVQTEIEDGVHHAWHRNRGSGTYRKEQGVFRVAKAPPHLLFHQVQRYSILLLQQIGQTVATLEKLVAGGRGDYKAKGHGQPQLGHLAEVSALASQQVTIILPAFIEQIDALRHKGQS